MKAMRSINALVIGLVPVYSFFATPNRRAPHALLYSARFDTLAHPSELVNSGQLLDKLKEKRVLLEELKESREKSLLQKLKDKQDVIAEDFDDSLVAEVEPADPVVEVKPEPVDEIVPQPVIEEESEPVAGAETDPVVAVELEEPVAEVETEPAVEDETVSFYFANREPVETETVAEETPVLVEETPAIAEETPVVAEETPVVVEETPVVAEETPVVVEETPVVAEETPVVVEETPVVVEEPITATKNLFEEFAFEQTETPMGETPSVRVDGLDSKTLSEEYLKPFNKVNPVFPSALTNEELISSVSKTLREKYGYIKRNTLLATSFDCDEVNRPLEESLREVYGDNFNMGGLAGFPFGGATSFGAMAAHIPDGGSCLVVYGPNVGVDSNGKVGTVERRGQGDGGACLSSAVAASRYVNSVLKGEAEKATVSDDPLDAQQYFVGKMIMPYAERLDNAKDKDLELPYVLYEAQTDLMDRILEKSGGAVANGKTAVLGGIQINTPPGYTDYFLPLSFKLYNNEGKEIEDLMWN